MKHGTLKLACLALAVVAFVTSPLVAKADTITLELISGATNITITDNGVGDSNPAIGQITYIGAVGGWNLNVTTGSGTAVLKPGSIDVNSVDETSGSTPLKIIFTDSSLTTPVGNQDYTMAVGGTLGSGEGITYQAFYNATLLNTLGAFTSGPGFSGATGGTNDFVSPYSLQEQITLTASGVSSSQSSFDASFAIPEPASLSLLGLGFVVAAGGLRKRLLNR